MTSAYNVAEYSASDHAFDCALSGPFANQFLSRLSAPRALCAVLIDVISASTVYNIISPKVRFVNSFRKIIVIFWKLYVLPKIIFIKKSLQSTWQFEQKSFSKIWINPEAGSES